MKRTICILLAALMAISLLSCGGEVPETPTETPPETPSATPETVTTPVTTEPEAEELAVQAYSAIAEIASGQLYMRATGRTDYVGDALFEGVAEGTMTSDAQETLGQPHYIYPYRDEITGLGLAHAYVVEDGSVFAFSTAYYEVEPIPNKEIISIFQGSITEYISHLEDALYTTPLAVSDPDETMGMIHDTIMSALCTEKTERTDYPTFDDAKKIYTGMTVEEVDVAMGTPHYVQLKEDDHNETRFYVLSNGVLMVVNMYYTALNTTLLSYYRLYNAENIMHYLEGHLVYTPKV